MSETHIDIIHSSVQTTVEYVSSINEDYYTSQPWEQLPHLGRVSNGIHNSSAEVIPKGQCM